MKENFTIERGQKGRGEAMTFEKAKGDMIAYLTGELKKVQGWTRFGELSERMIDEASKYLTNIIRAMEGGDLFPAREYFGKLKAEKDQVVSAAAARLREAIETAQPRIEALQREKAKYEQAADEAKRAGDIGRMNAFLKEVGNVEDAIRGVKGEEVKARQDLARALNDPDLEKFTNFVAAIDAKLEHKAAA